MNLNDLNKEQRLAAQTLEGPVLEDEGMHVFEHWGGEYHPLEELLGEMDAIKAQNR